MSIKDLHSAGRCLSTEAMVDLGAVWRRRAIASNGRTAEYDKRGARRWTFALESFVST
uniref:Uncharacterized protein n=1 Tax=Parascaris univalens TaxID=6257 RepID=A0A914ZJ65_PARUN